MVTLAEAKAHLALAAEDQGDDALIQGFIDAAVDHLDSIGVPAKADPLPPAIRQAIMLLVGHFYMHREAAVDAPVPPHILPFGVARLIAPYRSLDL